MPAFYSAGLAQFLADDAEKILGILSERQGGPVQPAQMRAWRAEIELLKNALSACHVQLQSCAEWGILIEYPLFRVGKRIDVVILIGGAICVLEFKVGANEADAASKRQVQDYALDLQAFHRPSRAAPLFCAVCATNSTDAYITAFAPFDGTPKVYAISPDAIAAFLLAVNATQTGVPQIDLVAWDRGEYAPIPKIIEAASMLYRTHSVDEIRAALSSHAHLNRTIDRLAEIANWAKTSRRHAVCFVTGVPGSGKTLVGLDLAHDPRFQSSGERTGGAVFLSGNSPLVRVLGEALARDAAAQKGTPIADERRSVRATIQHIINFLKEYLEHQPTSAPHDHIVVFDEAQRAWDEEFGRIRFGRTASEPYFLLDILGRHPDWALIVALVGSGQEINTGENGLSEWGKALQKFNEEPERQVRWVVFGSEDVVEGRAMYGGSALWAESAPKSVELLARDDLHLPITIRSFRNEVANEWIAALLDGRQLDARRLSAEVADFPIYVTRSLEAMRSWLRATSLGNRRFGLVASSGARRLRGYGLGAVLSAADLNAIVHWFLADRTDVRSSFALEVTGNEFACQGLELDRVGVCWDHDMTWSGTAWRLRTFKGTRWTAVRDPSKRRYIVNSYRVLLSRAREALIIWIPPGDPNDPTRPPEEMERTYRFLLSCGVRRLEDIEIQAAAVS